MRLGFGPELEAFRAQAAAWLETQMSGPFAHLRGINNHVDETEARRVWERTLGEARWSCIGWPEAWGGRGASLAQQVIFAEEYARARAPARIGHIGVELAGPTLLAFGTEAQKQRFLPGIAAGEDIWCQGYSEPGAGSDLANVRTTARREGERWVLQGQKLWTSMGQFADWAFMLCRTTPGSRGAKGLSYLLVPMKQPGVTVRPIRQMTGEAEFNEVFLDGAVTEADNLVGEAGDGWRVAMATLAFERGVSTLAQQMQFRNELEQLVAIARENGRARDPLIRQRLAAAHVGLQVMRANALRMLSPDGDGVSRAALTYKLYWSNWRRDLGELAMDVMGPPAETAAEGPMAQLVAMFLRSRSETIYAGTNEIQRNIIAERGLGLPREPRPA